MSNHERIHIAQATELLVVPFYALWLGDFAYGMIRHKCDAKEAYRHIRLEQEPGCIQPHPESMDEL